MEFTDLTRYFPVNDGRIAPFSELRKMKQVLFTHSIELVQSDENIEYAKQLADQGHLVVPIRRLPQDAAYVDRNTFPRRILFEMTSRCNVLCKMCPQHGLTRPRTDMDTETYKRVLDEIDEHGVEGLWIYHLGEPLLHPNFKELLEYVSLKDNIQCKWMSTNGMLFDKERIGWVLKSKLDFVNLSVHAVSAEVYNTVVPTGDFKVVSDNLETFYAVKGTENLPKRPFLHCQMIEQDTTAHEVDAFIERHYQRADIVSVNMLEYVGLENNSFGIQQRDRKPLTNCTRVERGDCFIFSNGDVTLCDAAFNAEIKLGNIHEQSLYEIWNGEERQRLLKLNAEGKMAENSFCCTCTDYDI